jgi:hypothetical protein
MNFAKAFANLRIVGKSHDAHQDLGENCQAARDMLKVAQNTTPAWWFIKNYEATIGP